MVHYCYIPFHPFKKSLYYVLIFPTNRLMVKIKSQHEIIGNLNCITSAPLNSTAEDTLVFKVKPEALHHYSDEFLFLFFSPCQIRSACEVYAPCSTVHLVSSRGGNFRVLVHLCFNPNWHGGNTFISLGFLDQILSADFLSKLYKTFWR